MKVIHYSEAGPIGNIPAKPSFYNMLYGACIMVHNSLFNKTSYKIPDQIGTFKRVQEVLNDDNAHTTANGVYTDGKKKVFIKLWQGTQHDLLYYLQVNELRMSALLYQKLRLNRYKHNIKVPKAMGYVETNKLFAAVYEYIEGDNGESLSVHESAETLKSSILGLAEVSRSLTTYDRKFFSTRGKLSYYILIPLLAVAVVILRPLTIISVCKTVYQCLMALQNLDTNLVLTHRDLTPTNIIKKGSTIYLLDLENMALTFPGYDAAYIVLMEELQPIAQTSSMQALLQNKEFYFPYILLHQSVGSGSFFKINGYYFKKMLSLSN